MKDSLQEAIQKILTERKERHLARRTVAMILVIAILLSLCVSWTLHRKGLALEGEPHYYCGKEEHVHTESCYALTDELICGYEEGEKVPVDGSEADSDSDSDDWEKELWKDPVDTENSASKTTAASKTEKPVAKAEKPAASESTAASKTEAKAASKAEPVIHHHTSACYKEEYVLTCDIDSDHKHDELCYDQETGELICPYHEHNDDCYTLQDVLVCGYEEGEPESSAPSTSASSVVTKEETDEFDDLFKNDVDREFEHLYDIDKTDDSSSVSTDDDWEKELWKDDASSDSELTDDEEKDLEKEETASSSTSSASEPESTSSSSETTQNYTIHHHTDACYKKILVCGKEEHVHTAECLINPNQEVDEEFEAKTPERTTADWPTDMVAVAQSQLGYQESKTDVDEFGNGYTMYADQYYGDKPVVYADWDSTFVAYCLYHAGVPQDVIPQYAGISALRSALAMMNSPYYTDDASQFAAILPGDIVMYRDANGDETIGVVEDIETNEEDLTTGMTVISGDVETGYDSETETSVDEVAEVHVALEDVTSTISVNRAYGLGTLDGADAAGVQMAIGGSGPEDDKTVSLTDENNDLNTEAFKSFDVVAKWKSGSGNTDWTTVAEDYVFTEGDALRVDGTFVIDPRAFVGADGTILKNTVVWNSGLTLGQALENGEIKDGNGKVVGTLSVTEDGVATMVFDTTAIDLSKADTVTFWFRSIATKSDDSNQEKVTFPGTGTTITIKKDTDLSARKTLNTQNIQYDNSGNPYIEYSITVESEKGTFGKVSIKDQFEDYSKLGGTYQDFVLKKYDKNNSGTEIAVTPAISNPAQGANASAQTGFEIKDLDALKAGEKYVLTYKYYLDKDFCTDHKLSGWIKNKASVTDEGNQDIKESSAERTFPEINLISKSGSYSAENGKVTWTIMVRNPSGSNLGGYTITDAIGSGSTAKIDPDTFQIKGGSAENNCNHDVNGTLTMNDGSQGFTYTFPENANEKYYKITYTSDAPLGESSIPNTATIGKDGKIDGSDGKDVGISNKGISLLGKATSTDPLADVSGEPNLKKAGWYYTIALPRGVRADTVTVEDVFEQPVNGEQYALLGELFQQLNRSGGAMEVYLEGTGGTIYRPQHWSGNNIEVSYTFKTMDDQEITLDSQSTPTEEQKNLKVKGFTTTVHTTNGTKIWKVNVGKRNNVYTTYVDISKMKPNETWTITNTIKNPNFKDAYANSHYTKPDAPKETEELKKLLDNSGNGGGYSFQEGSVNADFANAKTNGVFYKIVATPKKTRSSITITDTLPEGMVYDPSLLEGNGDAAFRATAHAVFIGGTMGQEETSGLTWDAKGLPDTLTWDGGSYDLKDNFTVTPSADGRTLTFTIKNLDKIPDSVKGTMYKSIGILYALEISRDDAWDNLTMSTKTYGENKINGMDMSSASGEVTVNRSGTYLDKNATNVTTDNRVNGSVVSYQVEINKSFQNLNPKEKWVTLYDELLVNNKATATLDRSSIKLIKHTSPEDVTGTETTDYTLITDVENNVDGDAGKTRYKMELTVLDDVWYTLTYNYTLDHSRGQDGQEVTVTNRARITAQWQNAAAVTYRASQGGGTIAAEAGQLNLVKVNQNNENETLQGAEFTLYALERGGSLDWQPTNLTVKTDGNGKITIIPHDTESVAGSTLYVKNNTLYKLVETKAPDGYVLEENKAVYFIWSPDDVTNEASRSAAYTAATTEQSYKPVANGEISGSTDPKLNYYQSGRQYGYDITVTNAPLYLDFEKVWKDENGHVVDAPADVKEIRLDLYKYQGDTFDKDTATRVGTITLNEANGWQKTYMLTGSTEADRYYVEEVDVPAGYTVSYTNRRTGETTQLGFKSGDIVSVSNQKRPTKLTVYKSWKDADGDPLDESLMEDVTIHLWGYAKGADPNTAEEKGSYKLTKADNWTHVFDGLDPDCIYSVTEDSMAGFTSAIVYDSDGTKTGTAPGGAVTVTNTYSGSSYELPATGATGGTIPYTAGGAALCLLALLGINARKRKRNEE